MMNLLKRLGVAIFFILGIYAIGFCEEKLTVTTYYPSPVGSYNKLFTYDDTYLAINGGRVGIGMSDPQYPLDVKGKIHASNDIITDRDIHGSSCCSDYVFDPGYKMMSLKELKKFIAKKKHLPNMLSAKEIPEEGVGIFEQSRLMLEKLEEAYLYIITLEERIAKLESALAKK